MDDQDAAEALELERVLFRLCAIDSDARLEQVLRALLPKLLQRYELKVGDSKPKQLLVQIFNHLARWLKPPSVVQLPIQDLAIGITKFEAESEALRLSLMFIEIGFARAAEGGKHECLRALLKSRAKFSDSLPQVQRLLFAVLRELEVDEDDAGGGLGELDWVSHQCIEACFALRNQPSAMEFLLRTKQIPPERLLVASILCATSNDQVVVRLGREGVKKSRDECDSRADNGKILSALFELVLIEKRTAWGQKVLAVELLTRYCKALSEQLCKVVISGLCAANVPVPLRIATLGLLQETSALFPPTGPLDALISNSLQKSQDFTSAERVAYLSCLVSWLRTRHRGQSWKARHLLALLQEQFLSEIGLEPVLHALLAKLDAGEVKLVVSSSTVLDLAETAPKTLQSFLTELAVVGSKVDLVAASWILLCQPSRTDAVSLVARPKFDLMFPFVQQRVHDAFPARVMRFLLSLLEANSELVDVFVIDHVKLVVDGDSATATQGLACDCVVALLGIGNVLVEDLITWDWLRGNLQSPNSALHLAASKVVGPMFSPAKWQMEITNWIANSLSRFVHEPGAILAVGEVPTFAEPMAVALETWLLSKEFGEYTDLAFQSLTSLVLRPDGRIVTLQRDLLFAKAKSTLKRSDKQGVVMFIGKVWGNYELLLDELLSHSSDVKLPLQIATGVALRANPKALKRILEITKGEMSKRQRLSCAVVLEQMAVGESNSSLAIQDAFLTLLSSGEEEPVKLCCCRGLAQNYLQASPSSNNRELTASLIRRFTVQTMSLDRQLQELCIAATQTGNSALVFYFFAVVGDLSPFPNEEFDSLLAQAAVVRKATQFIRRRHLDASPMVQKVASRVFPTAASVKLALTNVEALQSVYQDASRLLKDSFVMSERKSGLQTMVECLTQHGKFIAPAMETWRDVFRALDDLDDAISAHTALGHLVKRLTLKLGELQGLEEEEVFAFLLANGLGSPVLKVRHLTRSFFMDSVSSKRLPAKFAVRLIEALLRTIGESESAALQYAQFHTRGGNGTGELAVEAHKLEELRCRLALESVEYASILKCVFKVTELDSLFVAIARVVRTGVGLATLASAVALVQFLCSEESTSLASRDESGVLLSALTFLLLRDPSLELKRRTLFAAGKLAALPTASFEARLAYLQSISDFYDKDPEQSAENRLLAAQACKQVAAVVVDKPATPKPIARAAFLGRFDEDPAVAECWKECWMEMRVAEPDKMDMVHEAMLAYSYRQRRQGAQCLMGSTVLLHLVAAATSGDGKGLVVVEDMIKLVAGADWEGRDVVIKATGHVVQYIANNPELIINARQALEACLFGQTVTSKWTLQALFEAMQCVWANPSVDLASTVPEFVHKCARFAFGDALVIVAMLACLQTACQSQSDDNTALLVVDFVSTKVFNKQASWNVKVGCLKLFGLCQAKLVPQSAVELAEQLLDEEKKPSVLVALLTLVRRFKLSPQAKAAVERLAKHSDPAVCKLAIEVGSNFL